MTTVTNNPGDSSPLATAHRSPLQRTSFTQYFHTGVDYTFNFLPILGVTIIYSPYPRHYYDFTAWKEGNKE